ncbi:MAG: hypothetical protein WC717_03135 [Candidatus Micrarchaeia archaeon]|jgi:hypothetical protein
MEGKAGQEGRESPEQRLSALLGEGLEPKIAEKIGIFGGLLSRDAAVLLLCQESGISAEKRLLLSEARASRLPFSFSARVGRIFPLQKFPGGGSSCVRLHISDRSWEATLVLWNEQASIVQGEIMSGDEIVCSGAYFRSGEIAIGRNGSIARAGASSSMQVGSLKEGACNVEGRVERVEAARTYIDRKSGEKKTMNSFSVCSGGKCVRAIAWSLPEGARLPQEGEEVLLESAAFRGGELHLNSFSRIVAKGNQGKAGVFMGVRQEGGLAVVAIGDEKFPLPVPGALSLLGLQSVPQGVDAFSLLSIKASSLEGKPARYFSEAGRLASLEFES